jgi:hypothetical protein
MRQMSFSTNTLLALATMRGCAVWLGCLLSLCAVQVAEGQPAKKVDFNCERNFQSIIQTNEVLLLAGIDVAKAADGKTYLLALGTAITQSKESPDAKAKLGTRKVAEAKARRQAAEFLQTKVHTETRLTEIRNSEKVSTNEGLKQQLTKLIKTRQEIIIQRSQATLGGSKVVATWISDGNSLFSAVVAVEVNGGDKQ